MMTDVVFGSLIWQKQYFIRILGVNNFLPTAIKLYLNKRNNSTNHTIGQWYIKPFML